MALFKGKERAIAEAMSRLTAVNPFLPERIAFEQEVLGDAFVGTRQVWSVDAKLDGMNPNLEALEATGRQLLDDARARLAGGTVPTSEEQQLYEDLVLYRLYAGFTDDWRAILEADSQKAQKVTCYAEFERTAEHYLEVRGFERRGRLGAPFLFAYGYQTYRAFHFVFRQLYGGSLPAAELRAAAWQSIFSADRGRYRRVLVDRMHDYATLITGPSGTGKELVARAIGHARFLPFDPTTSMFASAPGEGFFPLNLSALSPTLIESELFGHKRGAFTGAVEDRAGWLETAGSLGTVFLDEIGDLDGAIQVKLLRVLQSRTFQRLGETTEREFEGKVIAATNRDLGAEMQAGRFREDLYYRLCSDRIETPSLAGQIEDHPEDLHNLILVIARRLFGKEGDEIAATVNEWVKGHLGVDYTWPGNIRELEQCVRNVVIRGAYHPMGRSGPSEAATQGARGAFAAELVAGSLDTDQLLARYTALVYHQTGSYEEAARRLAIDRRTVKARIDRGFLADLEDESSA
jgi:transcriptional regulator with AAA-type ATPase domain